MDVVPNLLDSIRLTGGAFLRIDLRAPFSIETMSGIETCVAFGHRYEHVIPYHLVVRGSCWARVHGENPLQLDTGQIILLPRGEPHTPASDTQLRATKVTKFLPPTVGPGPLALESAVRMPRRRSSAATLRANVKPGIRWCSRCRGCSPSTPGAGPPRSG